MSFESLFKLLSYLTVLGGFLSLWVTGTLGTAGPFLFASILIAGWFLEGNKWQISERIGTTLIVLSLPMYFIAWKTGFFYFPRPDSILPGILARLILTLSAIKLLQRKTDRDWLFLYIMAFFEVLLAAGISISAFYLASFLFFFFVVTCSIIAFEIRRTRHRVMKDLNEEQAHHKRPPFRNYGRIPFVAAALLTAIVVIAIPMFFVIPRVGGAGIGSSSGEVSARSGFSPVVHLGGIGTIQQNDEIVMRVRIEGDDPVGDLKWRGVALDTFDGEAWSTSAPVDSETYVKGPRDIIQVDTLSGREKLLLQTIYLEPLDTAVIFAAPRAVGIQGNFSFLKKDRFGSISYQPRNERTTYKVLSDRTQPPDTILREDTGWYSLTENPYLQLPPRLDPRIAELTAKITVGDKNRFDAAKHIEQYLRTQFAYSLEMKAGGPDPLSDFLFNVKAGHCEYFATAMAVMLRTKGIATRIVNGFQLGDYNDTADVFVVRQKHAHSWVEVYFPGSDAWVAFDPTPSAGPDDAAGGITGRIGKYMEALEMFWIQYFVAFDNQEQRSLFTTVKKGVSDYGSNAASYIDTMQRVLAEWWKDARGENGDETRVFAIVYGAAVFLSVLVLTAVIVTLTRKIVRLKIWRRLRERFFAPRVSIVGFYDRLLRALANLGFERDPAQTPMEFAAVTGIPEAVKITEKYNLVRFGGRPLTGNEAAEIEDLLRSITSNRRQ